MRRIGPFVGFVLIVVLLGLLLLRDRGGQPEVVRAFPALSLTAFDAKAGWDARSLSGQVTVVTIFASWCAPCATEMPELEALKKAHPEVRLMGIAWNDAPDVLRGWLRKHGRPFHSVWLDPEGSAAIALGLKGVPETLVVDAKGMIRYRLAGVLTPAIREKVVDPLLVLLLKEQADAR